MPPRSSRSSPAKPRPKPRPVRSPKKKIVSSAFVDDEAVESDDGVLVDRPDIPPNSSPVEENQGADGGAEDLNDKYESDFIDDGDVYDLGSLGYPSPSPPPSLSRLTRGRAPADEAGGGSSPTSPSPKKGSRGRVDSKAVDGLSSSPESPSKISRGRATTRAVDASKASVVADDVIELTSDEDLEAMAVDDTVFKKPANVKPSALPPSLMTRSTASKMGLKLGSPYASDGTYVVDPPAPVPSGSKARASKSASAASAHAAALSSIDPSNLDDASAKALGDWAMAFLQNQGNKNGSGTALAFDMPPNPVPPSTPRGRRRVDHDQLALKEGIRSSLSVSPPLPTKIRDLSPDWDPPFAGNLLDELPRTPPNKRPTKSTVTRSRSVAGKGKSRYVSPEGSVDDDNELPVSRAVPSSASRRDDVSMSEGEIEDQVVEQTKSSKRKEKALPTMSSTRPQPDSSSGKRTRIRKSLPRYFRIFLDNFLENILNSWSMLK
ncbi:hypothetical protein C8R47DRAFT_1144572 [Mycena vitilis]|nr:hypothetical protein C8R47DRAFT_1144572 [Mycena vitilis]